MRGSATTGVISQGALPAALALLAICATGAAATEGRVDADVPAGCRNLAIGTLGRGQQGLSPMGTGARSGPAHPQGRV